MKKILYMILGCISVGWGAAGVVIPVLPTVPFLMFALFVLPDLRKNWIVGLRTQNYTKRIWQILRQAEG